MFRLSALVVLACLAWASAFPAAGPKKRAEIFTSSNPLKNVFKLPESYGTTNPIAKPTGPAAKAFSVKKIQAPLGKAKGKAGYIPDGLSQAQYAKVVAGEETKRAKKVAFWAKKRTEKVETLDEWFSSVYNDKKKAAGAGHRFVKTKYDWSGGQQ